jgi:hypothetical protein
MKPSQFFSHRPPTSGIHLLSDPFPERLNGTTSLFSRAESLSSQREFLAASQRLRVVTGAKK